MFYGLILNYMQVMTVKTESQFFFELRTEFFRSRKGEEGEGEESGNMRSG
jgi:hypothetical protein